MEWDDRGAANGANPYSAPVARIAEAAVGDGQPVLAGRMQRLLAVIVDSLVVAVPAIVLAIALPAYRDATQRAGASGGGDSAWLGVAAVVVGALFAGYLVYQVYWLWKSGQTFGKKVMSIRIVRSDGSRAGLGRLLLLRYLLPGVVGNIPRLGLIVSLADVLFIFGERRRCLHDLVADTIVVVA